MLHAAGDARGPFTLATFPFTISRESSLVTVDFVADGAVVSCSGDLSAASAGLGNVSLSITDASTGASVGTGGTGVSSCVANTNTAGTTILCGPMFFKAAISGATLPPGSYSGAIVFTGRCANASTSVVVDVTSTISLGPGVLSVVQVAD